MRATAFVAAGVAVFAAGFAISPHKAAALEQRPAVGVQFHATWSDYTDAQRAEVLDKLAAAGVKWVRIDLGWASLEERGPGLTSQWYLELADRAVDQARARGLRVLCTLWATPGWANGNAGRNVPPSDPGAYARAAAFAAAHFRGRVAAWEVWNEPNLPDFFAGDAGRYAQLLRAAYPAFKGADPGALVLLGGPSENDTDWLRAVYAAGAQGAFDVLATHPYMGVADAPPELPDDGSRYTISHVAAVHELMRANGDGAKPIWFTEFGWSSHPNWPGVENWNRGVSPELQADYLVRSLRYIGANYPYVTNVFWYNERNLASGVVQLDNYGLLNRDLSPKPAYTALKDYLGGAGAASTTTPVTTTTPKSNRPKPKPRRTTAAAHKGQSHRR
jgi:hypothetical protein